MKAKLTNNYIHFDNFFMSRQDREKQLEFKKWVEENRGKWVDIETEHLFDNQYNTIGGRIYDTWIDEMQDDERTLEKFPNCFFLKYPKGKDKIKDVRFTDHLKNERFYSCSNINNNYYRISRRSSIEFILVGELIYITNGIGYTELNKARLTPNEKTIVKYCANRILCEK